MTTLQEDTIQALLTERYQKAAAEKAGISEATLYKWFRDEAFRAALDAARRELRQQTIVALAQRRAERVLQSA